MFRGISIVTIDAKGRIAIPTRYREQLQAATQSHLVMTIDPQEPCLLLYPLTEWEIVEQKIEALPSFNRTTRSIQRLLIGHAAEMELDTNGRIVIPPLLRAHANIDEKHVMLIGQGKKFEIWAKNTWQQGREHWLAETFEKNGQVPDELHLLSL